MELIARTLPDKIIPFMEEPREDLFPEEEGEIINTMDVTRKIYAIRQVEKLVEQYEQQDQESRAFYAMKKEQCQKRIDYIKRNILGFLTQMGLHRLSTPAGTAYTRTNTTKHWPDDAVLIAWAKDHAPEAIVQKESPDKRMISAALAANMDPPQGYFETTDTKLHII